MDLKTSPVELDYCLVLGLHGIELKTRQVELGYITMSF
jgi:hypothetical protein